MNVNLSPLAGAAWQFFGDNGLPLAGGKLYTYTAGSTTPQTTYTSSAGVTANSNPIFLNASGRLANEVWLAAQTEYKFVLKTSTDVLIGTYDNISGINAFAAPVTVSLLGSASPSGQRRFVSDATATTFAAIVSGGGITAVPVYSDGTNWRIG